VLLEEQHLTLGEKKRRESIPLSSPSSPFPLALLGQLEPTE